MTGSQVLMLTESRACADVCHGVRLTALVAGASDTRRAGFLLRALCFTGFFKFAWGHCQELVNAKRESATAIKADDFGAEAARRDITRPTAGRGPHVNAAKVYAHFLGTQFALHGLGDHTKVGAFDAGRFNVWASDVQQQRLCRVADR